MAVFWDAIPCSTVVVDRRFRVFSVHNQGDDGGSKLLWNVGQYLPHYTLRHSVDPPPLPLQEPMNPLHTSLIQGQWCRSSGGKTTVNLPWIKSGLQESNPVYWIHLSILAKTFSRSESNAVIILILLHLISGEFFFQNMAAQTLCNLQAVLKMWKLHQRN
jgi:hypothetical protein